MSKRPSLMGMVEKKPAAAPAEEPREAPQRAPASAAEAERMRVVVRLNIEAVEALEDIAKERRREEGRSVPLQRIMEEAVEDVLRKHGRSAVVLPVTGTLRVRTGCVPIQCAPLAFRSLAVANLATCKPIASSPPDRA